MSGPIQPPQCPVDYTCSFAMSRSHDWQPWYYDNGGAFLFVLISLALMVLIGYLTYLWHERAIRDRRLKAEQKQSAHDKWVLNNVTNQISLARSTNEILRILEEHKNELPYLRETQQGHVVRSR